MSSPNVTKSVWAGRIALAPVFTFIATLFCALWYSTQYVAGRLAYQRQLGDPWFRVLGHPFYSPFKVVPWNYHYHFYAPSIFMHGMLIIVAGALVAMISSLTYALWIARRARVATSGGTASWAGASGEDSAGLKVDEGVILARSERGGYLRAGGERHVLLAAPTGSGKGVGQIIPTLLSWPHSVVVHDMSGENWEKTAGYRMKFSNVLYLDLTSPESCHFNPLLEIRPGLNEVKDAQNIVAMLIDPLGKRDLPFWEREASTLLTACILHVLYCEADKSLPGVSYFLSNPQRSATQTIDLMRTRRYPSAETTRFINSSAQQAAQKYEKELSGVISTCLSVLGLFRDPLIAKITSDSDFKIADLVEGKYPVSLYFIVPPTDELRLTPLARLIWSQIGRQLMESQREKAKRHQILLLMDEFASLGYMEIFHTGIARMRGFGIKLHIIVQSLGQLIDIYGPNHAFTSNCDVRVFYTPNDNTTAEVISTALGPKTEVHQQKTYTGHRLSPWLGHVMVSDQEGARPLLTPGEVLTYPDDQCIIFVRSCRPLQAKKLRYYADPNFTRRVLPPPKLRTTRPYPYRVPPRPNLWNAFAPLESGAGAEGATNGSAPAGGAEGVRPTKRGANEEHVTVHELVELEPEGDRREGANEQEHSAGLDPPGSDESFEQWHQLTVARRGREIEGDGIGQGGGGMAHSETPGLAMLRNAERGRGRIAVLEGAEERAQADVLLRSALDEEQQTAAARARGERDRERGLER